MSKHDKWLRTVAAIALVGQLSACAGANFGAPGKRPDGGLLIADEPVATLAARSLMTPKATAADIAVALGFGLSVTYPVAASLGGGGLCLYHDSTDGSVETIEFLPRPAAAGGAIAVPGFVQGFAELHARHGKLEWEKLIAPAQKLAAEGFDASDAYVMRLADSDASFAVPQEYAKIYSGILTQGRRVVQPKLGEALTVIAQEGVQGFYAGPVAEKFVRDNTEAQGRVSAEDLAAYRVASAPAQTYWLGTTEIRSASRPELVSSAAYGLWMTPPPVSGIDGEAISKAALASVGVKTDYAPDLGTTGFIVADQMGDVAVCTLTMNGPFGARSMTNELGFPFGLSPVGNAAFTATATLQPTIALQAGGVVLAAAAGGSPNTLAALRDVVLSARTGPKAVAEVLDANPSGPIATLPTMLCPAGYPRDAHQCRYSPTRGGYGIAVTTGKGFGGRY